MKFQLATALIACGSIALFSAVWLNRRTRDLVPSGRRHQFDVQVTAVEEPSGVEPAANRGRGGSWREESAPDHGWYAVDLFGSTPPRAGSRFDDTVALPIDTPRRLEEIIEAATLRLRALPEPDDLGPRTIAYRGRLQQIIRDATQARTRLAAGTYGDCTECAAPISLALLTQRPWTRLCVYCALDI